MKYIYLLLINFSSLLSFAQLTLVFDDFEGNGSITSWTGDDCGMTPGLLNPFQQGINTSMNVLEYHDIGGQYANIRFEVDRNFELINEHTFSLKIFIPSSGLTGNEPNQIALKLQNGNLPEPWLTQCEIIKPVTLDEWQIVTFNFKTDNYINLDQNSLPPTQRFDFNRVVLQVNGENNDSNVLAYLDDIDYDGVIPIDPVFNDLVWSDEFENDGALDQSNWFHQTQLPAGGSWFNNEIQHYTDRIDNSFVENGVLKILAKKESFTDQGYTKQYTSARLNSKFAFQYGKVEIRAKLPSGVGTWPALWMLGKNISESGAYWQTLGFGTTSWPDCGEIDIMEHWGDNQNYVQSATHTPSSFGDTNNKGGQTISTASSDFHVYTLKWTEEKLIFSIDDVVHYVYFPLNKNSETWPFDAEQYLIFNIAIQQNIAASFSESAMEIDYVRIYQNNPPTAVEELSASPPFDYYPNPVNDEFIINFQENTEQNINVRIYSIAGILVQDLSIPADGNSIKIQDLKRLSKGIYLVHFNLRNESYNLKFVKH